MREQVGGTGVGGVDAHEGKRMIEGIASALERAVDPSV